MTSQVAILRTRPETVLEDYGRLMRLVKYDQTIGRDRDLILKLNLSWTKYFPACSSQPWQLDGVVRTLLAAATTAGRSFRSGTRRASPIPSRDAPTTGGPRCSSGTACRSSR